MFQLCLSGPIIPGTWRLKQDGSKINDSVWLGTVAEKARLVVTAREFPTPGLYLFAGLIKCTTSPVWNWICLPWFFPAFGERNLVASEQHLEK